MKASSIVSEVFHLRMYPGQVKYNNVNGTSKSGTVLSSSSKPLQLGGCLTGIGQTRLSPFVMRLNGPDCAGLAAHDDGICNGSTRSVMDTLEKITIRDPGRGKEDFLTLKVEARVCQMNLCQANCVGATNQLGCFKCHNSISININNNTIVPLFTGMVFVLSPIMCTHLAEILSEQDTVQVISLFKGF